MRWSFRSSLGRGVVARKNSDIDLIEDEIPEIDKPTRQASEGESTACEDWSDMDEEDLNSGFEVDVSDDDVSESSIENTFDGENATPERRLSRFSIFQRSAPIIRGNEEDLSFTSPDVRDHDEQVPSAQEIGTLRHLVRENTHHEDVESELHLVSSTSSLHDKVHNNALNHHRETTPVVHRDSSRINPYQTKEHAPSTVRTRLEVSLFFAYLCSCVVLALPVLLLPLVAAEITAESKSGMSVAGFAASVASVATLGAGVGKFVNGFVCKWLGGQQSSFCYLLGTAACSLFLSNTTTHVGLAMAGIEFFSSIQYTSMALVLTNHYERDIAKLTTGMTTVSFASTCGMLLANALGTALLQRHNWRRVAQFGATVALVGAMIIRLQVKEFPLSPTPSGMATSNNKTANAIKATHNNERLTLRGVASSMRHVLGSRLFWQAGIAHAMAFLARTSDRVLGTFFQETTLLPHNISGGLLACLALGYVHGLLRGKEIIQAKTAVDKSRLITKRYAYAVLSTLGLALCANNTVTSVLRQQSNMLLILAVALSSGAMTSFLAFQIYLLPPMVANTFGKNKPVCLSFLDGLGYFLASPIWATTSRIVTHPRVEPHGWSVAWTMLALFFATGGILMMRALPPVLHKQTGESQPSPKDQQSESCCRIVHLA